MERTVFRFLNLHSKVIHSMGLMILFNGGGVRNVNCIMYCRINPCRIKPLNSTACETVHYKYHTQSTVEEASSLKYNP